MRPLLAGVVESIIPSFFICVSFGLVVLASTSMGDSDYVNGALLASMFLALATSFSYWMNPCEQVCQDTDFQAGQDHAKAWPTFTFSTPRPSVSSLLSTDDTLSSFRSPNPSLCSHHTPNVSLSSYQTPRCWITRKPSSSSLVSSLPSSFASYRESFIQSKPKSNQVPRELGMENSFVVYACIVAGFLTGLAFCAGSTYVL